MRWSWWASLGAHAAFLASVAAAAGNGLVGPVPEAPVCFESAVTPEHEYLPRSTRSLFSADLVPEPERFPDERRVPEAAPPEPEVALPVEEYPSALRRTPEPGLPPASVVVPEAKAPPAPSERGAAPDAAVADACPQPGNPRPGYPARALRLGLEGRVLVRLTVSADGTVRRAELERSSGSALLDEAALAALARWRFVPATCRGVPVDAAVLVPVEFRLESREHS